jgi:hypothetical protein
MLTPDQVERFRRDGVLILRDFFSQDEVARWRGEVQDYFETPGDGDSWRALLRIHKSDSFHPSDDPTPRDHPALARVYRSLHASAQWFGANELVVRAADEEAPWLGARKPHLDFPLYTPVRTLANNVIYLTDVETRGGALMYWPGSHRLAWDFFRRHPLDYLSRGDRGQDATFAALTQEMTGDPIEFVGRAGDLLIWHSLTLHSASINKTERTRLALIGRWGVDRGDAPIYDFDRDMWDYWDFAPAPALTEVSR